jgi:hypothetical protein
MKRMSTFVFALVVLFSGLALVPVMGLPAAGFKWQRYANAYVPTTLTLNHYSGAPGSFFTVTGTNYPPSVTATILANGVALGTVQTDSNGGLEFVIDTTGAELGYYTVAASPVPSVSTRFVLAQDEPSWPQGSGAPVLQVPADIALQLIFAPIIAH